MTDGFTTFEMGVDDEGIGVKSKRWAGETGRTTRFSVIWWAGLEDGEPKLEGNPKFAAAKTHYIPNVGYVVNQGPEYTKLAGGIPRQRVATIIIVWPTDKMGNVDKTRLAAGEGEAMSWVFSGDKYNNLKRIHGEFPFHTYDITVECQDSKFQKLIFAPCRESLLQMLLKNPKAKEITDKLLTAAAALATNIGQDLGQVLTLQQIQEKLAGGPGLNAGSSALSVVPDAITTGQVDDIVGDLLG